MNIRQMVAISMAAACGVAVAGAAQAYQASATTAVHVRNGPGTQYRVVDTLRRGESVDVDQCSQGYGWCHVRHSGPDGWVSARFLSDARSRPLNQFAFSLNIPQFRLSIGNAQGPIFGPGPGRGPGPRDGRVCFYEDVNFRGNSFCANEGQSDRRLGGYWNDRISSIRVFGDADVRVCEHWDYGGRCTVVRNDRAQLGGRNNDIISSYRVM